MGRITDKQVRAARLHLRKSQMELALDLGMGGGLTTLSRWEHGHSKISPSWCRLLEEYFVEKIGKNWRKTVAEDPRVKKLEALYKKAESSGIQTQINANCSDEELVEAEKRLGRRIRELKRRK